MSEHGLSIYSGQLWSIALDCLTYKQNEKYNFSPGSHPTDVLPHNHLLAFLSQV